MPYGKSGLFYATRASLDGFGMMPELEKLRAGRKLTRRNFDMKEKEKVILSHLIPHQKEFVKDFDHKFIALCGGYGSGKTVAAVCKGILLAFRSPGFVGIFLEPTIPLLRDVAIPGWDENLRRFGIPYEFRGSPLPNYTLKLPGGDTQVFLRSMENVERLIGVNAAWVVADEIDTVRQEIAEKAVIKLQGRVRVGSCPQIAFASTPEGYKFMHKFFVKDSYEGDPNKRLIRAKTEDNPYLDQEYIEGLRRQYPPHLVQSYMEGQFVNLASATVFGEFDRKKHSTDVIAPGHDEIVIVGADFNIGRSMSVYGVIRDEGGLPVIHIFAEHQAHDTFALAQHLRRQFTNQILLKRLVVYPDASGNHAATSSTRSDHEILRDAGLRVITERKNPPVSETVAHANSLIHRMQVRVNKATCPRLLETLEQWGYDETYKPQKTNGPDDLSHSGDALRYLTWGAMPQANARVQKGPRWR